MSLLKAEKITKVFGKGHTAVRAVSDVSLDIKQGETILIMGPSGSGKTTLLSILGGLMKPDKGEVYVDGEEITKLTEKELPSIRLHKLGFIFQKFNLLSNLSALENVMIPMEEAGSSKAAAIERARGILKQLDLSDRADHVPKMLSGGEQQRVAIGRALANDPKIIFADEPTGNLDSKTGREVVELLCRISCRQGKGVIIVSHDQRIMDIADQKIWLEDGKIKKTERKEHNKLHS